MNPTHYITEGKNTVEISVEELAESRFVASRSFAPFGHLPNFNEEIIGRRNTGAWCWHSRFYGGWIVF